MPTETQLEQRVAALQSDLNERDQRTDDLQFQLKDREGSRRDWFEEAQRLQAMLAERDALLRECASEFNTAEASAFEVEMRRKIKAALSANADPAPHVERDERADFEVHRKSLGLCVKRMPGHPDLYEDNYTQGGWTSWQARAALERKKDNCELCGVTGIEPCTDCPGLDKATEGASHE